MATATDTRAPDTTPLPAAVARGLERLRAALRRHGAGDVAADLAVRSLEDFAVQFDTLMQAEREATDAIRDARRVQAEYARGGIPAHEAEAYRAAVRSVDADARRLERLTKRRRGIVHGMRLQCAQLPHGARRPWLDAISRILAAARRPEPKGASDAVR